MSSLTLPLLVANRAELTSKLSPLLLNCQKKVTLLGSAATWHLTFSTSSSDAPMTVTSPFWQTGASATKRHNQNPICGTRTAMCAFKARFDVFINDNQRTAGNFLGRYNSWLLSNAVFGDKVRAKCRRAWGGEKKGPKQKLFR